MYTCGCNNRRGDGIKTLSLLGRKMVPRDGAALLDPEKMCYLWKLHDIGETRD